jgi:RimJ/RimL family protein N-acetyltransferase
MIEVQSWSRLHRSQYERWQTDVTPLQSLFLLRARDEPFNYPVASLAVLFNRVLIGRFSHRMNPDGEAFIGLVLAPSYRGRGYAVPALRASLSWLAWSGVDVAAASVALANVASFRMLLASGFVPRPGCSEDWRDVPLGVDVGLLSGLLAGSWRLSPAPSLLYARLVCSLSVHMYAEMV